MAEPGDPDFDDGVYSYQKRFLDGLSETLAGQQSIELMWPTLEYFGRSAGGSDIAMTNWHATVNMYIDDNDGHEERLLSVGFLDLFTLPLDQHTAEVLDEISADTAAYIALLAGGGDVSDLVQRQFDYPPLSGLLILDRAYVHPALRGRGIGVWAVVEAVHALTFGSSGVLVVAYPTPIERRPGQTEADGAVLLAAHWARAGFERLSACPDLMGQSTAKVAFATARNALADIAGSRISLPAESLKTF